MDRQSCFKKSDDSGIIRYYVSDEGYGEILLVVVGTLIGEACRGCEEEVKVKGQGCCCLLPRLTQSRPACRNT